LYYFNAGAVSFINKEGVELFQISKDKTGSDTYDTVYRLCFNNYFGKLLNAGGYILHTGVYII
jgi:hypothetical protein